jgi:hypothetical protein
MAQQLPASHDTGIEEDEAHQPHPAHEQAPSLLIPDVGECAKHALTRA